MSLNADAKKVMRIIANKVNEQTQYIFFDVENYTITVKNKNGDVIKFYSADDAPTIKSMHSNSIDLHRLIMGPRGSMKSSGCCAEILFKSYLNPACIDGVKHSRWLVCRETYGELETTTIKTFADWWGCDELGWWINKKPPIQAGLKFFDGEALNIIELVFISFDNAESAKKAMSLELTGAYFNEAGKISVVAMDEVVGSIGRYPSDKDKVQDKEYWYGTISDTNSFPDYHPFFERYIKRPAPLHCFYKQPAGLLVIEPGKYVANPNAENLSHLPKDYYLKMTYGKTLSFIKTQILNEFGTHEDGKPVHPEYETDKHSVDEIEVNKNYPVWLMHDYGGTNATVVMQYINNQLRVIKEFIGYRQGLRMFQRDVVLPWIRLYLKDVRIERSRGDPSDNLSHENMIESSKIVSEELGIETRSAVSNNIKKRIDAVDRLILSNLGSGKYGLLVSRSGCPLIHAGMSGKYQLGLKRQGAEMVTVEAPIKDDYSHGCDCVQYGALEALLVYESQKNDDDDDIDLEAMSRGSIV